MGCLEVRVDGRHHREHAVEVDVDRARPLRVVDLVELLRGDDAGAVDEDVDARNLLEDLLDRLAGLRRVRDVELVEVVALAELGDGRLPLVLAASDEHDVAAALDDALGDLEADALGASGYDRGLSVEVKGHGSLPFSDLCARTGSPLPVHSRAFRRERIRASEMEG